MASGIDAKLALAAATSLVFTLGLSSGAVAQPAAAASRVTVSATVGVGVPQDQAYQEIYGRVSMPFTAQANVRIGRGFEAFGGLRRVAQSGTAIWEGGSEATATDEVSFSMTSLRAGAGWLYPRGAWSLWVGVGVSSDAYRESWEGLGTETSGRRTGLVVQAGVTRDLSRRIALVLRAEYVTGSTPPAAAGLDPVHLASFDAGGGIAIRF